MAATAMFMQLREYMTTFVLELESDEGELFTMMAEMGFFAQNGPFYRITLPDALTLEKVRTAVVKFAATEDDEFVLHPERLIGTVPFSEARTLQNRLRAIDNFCNYTSCIGRA